MCRLYSSRRFTVHSWWIGALFSSINPYKSIVKWIVAPIAILDALVTILFAFKKGLFVGLVGTVAITVTTEVFLRILMVKKEELESSRNYFSHKRRNYFR